MHINFAFFSYY